MEIEEEIINLDIEKIDFDDKEVLKRLFLMLLNRIELLAQENQLLRKENNLLQKDEIAKLAVAHPAAELRGMIRAAALMSWFLGWSSNTLHY